MLRANKGRGYVYYLRYHIVWCVKYRNAVLVGDVERDVKEILREIADEQKLRFFHSKPIKTMCTCSSVARRNRPSHPF